MRSLKQPRTWILNLAILLVALAFRLPWALQERIVRWDEADYLILAQNLLAGRGYQVFGIPELIWPPAMPALAALPMMTGLPIAYALSIWHMVFGAAACLLLFGLARDVTGDWRVALIAGLLAAAAPALAVWPLYWGSLTEAPFLALILAGLWASWRTLTRGGHLAALGAGLAFCLSYLIRTEGLVWWGLFLVILTAAALRRQVRWSAVALFALGFPLVALPYMVYLYQHTGRLLLSGKTGVVLLLSPKVIELGGLGQDYTSALDSSGQEILWLSPETLDISWLDIVRADPMGMLRQVRQNVGLAIRGLLDPMLGLATMALAGLGLFASAWDRRRWAGEAFWLVAVLPLAILFLTKVEVRYLSPLVAVALVWAACGLLHLANWVRQTVSHLIDRRLPLVTCLAPMLAVVLVLGFLEQRQVALEGQSGMAPSHRAAGQWLASNSEPNAPVMSRNTEVALYADRPVVAFPNAPWPQVLAYGQARNMRYLVADDWEIQRLRPQLSALLEPDMAPAELEHVATFQDPRRTTFVYRVLND